MRRDGFTLVEVLVALAVLQVGLLGVVGTLVLAARTLERAEREERGCAEVERVMDSLRAARVTSGAGRVESKAGEVRWQVTPGGTLRVTFSIPGDSALVVVQGLIPGGVGGSQ